ncbi:MAG TPA: UDP-N-acetylmuramoyl-L-alanine--D-glutamate ligase [Candidatus Ignatzschineria merdigallinarum]|uniref:UDP-N-acetylmuramoylalanine--D-glutamate ligase n=1 Tax=Candidatus Ignatzschineria merdigallinarum TaxID=2838621 RepID=A0A9D1Q6E2_9GAMM|nr:UDP-N-acetylmuramoyl-L-alanine--D-glutamate ligase [Candidatus Ignatzschineria merdigallinarum]
MFAADSKHLVVGFGITGLSIVKALDRLGVNHLFAMDSRDNPPNAEEITPLCQKVHIGSFESSLLDECDYLWVSPGIAIATPALAKTIARLPSENIGGDIELFARLVQENIVAITGTNGKSTVTTLVGSIFEAAGYDLYMGGNLGTPALDLWLNYCDRESHERIPLFLLELSSFQLETTDSLQADIGVILNLSPDHLDRYRDYQHYIDSKFKLLAQSKTVIVPAIEPAIDMALQKSEFQGFTKTIRFSLNREEHSQYWANLETKHIETSQLSPVNYAGTKLGGTHNILNIVSAVAIAESFGIDRAAIEAGIQNYQPLAHRSVFVKEIDGVSYFNDSKATNLSSTEAAILGFPEKKWLILGGVTKGQDFSTLETLLLNNVAGVALIGLDYSTILPHIPKGLPVYESQTLEVALNTLKSVAQKGDIILFSPACASFDQFKGFEHRGDVFEALVQKL